MNSIKNTLKDNSKRVRLLIIKIKNIEKDPEIILFITKIDIIILMIYYI